MSNRLGYDEDPISAAALRHAGYAPPEMALPSSRPTKAVPISASPPDQLHPSDYDPISAAARSVSGFTMPMQHPSSQLHQTLHQAPLSVDPAADPLAAVHANS